MLIDQNSGESPDRLSAATAALRAYPIADGPEADLLDRAEQIPTALQNKWFMRSPVKLVAAGMAILFLGVSAVLLLQPSGNVVFAEVVEAINGTRTFTAVVDMGALANNTAGIPPKAKISVKDTRMRIEATDSVLIIDQQTGQMLQLVPSKHQASTYKQQFEKRLDLYGMLRDFHTGSEESLGEKEIDGHKTQGFRTSPQSMPGETLILWVDPVTRLPVQVETGPYTMTDLHFDVPLEDALFDTNVPAGYNLAAAEKPDSWDLLKFSGQVVDERGKPIAGVEVEATDRIDTISPGGYGFGGGSDKSDKDGRFNIDAGDQAYNLHDDPIRLEFRHPDFLYARLEDMRLLPPEQRLDLHVRLRDGQSVSGTVVDSQGRPITGATVEAVYGRALPNGEPGDPNVRWAYSKIRFTDSEGKFELRGIAAAPVLLQVRGTGPAMLWGEANVDLRTSKVAPVKIVAHPLDLTPGNQVHQLFGMKLLELNDEMRDRLSLDAFDKVMILDPGPKSDRLEIGKLQAGDSFFMVDETRIKDFNDFAARLLATCEAQQKRGLTDFTVRVVYNSSPAQGNWSWTEYMRLNLNDLAELQKMVKP